MEEDAFGFWMIIDHRSRGGKKFARDDDGGSTGRLMGGMAHGLRCWMELVWKQIPMIMM